MQNENPQRPVSPLLKRLQTPEQNSIRKFLRIAGPIIFSIGLVCVIFCVASLFMSLGTYEHPRYFELGFVGLPLMFVGSVLSMYGFMGAVARFVAGESAPVAADTVNYMAEETKGAVETVVKAAAKGVVEGIDAGRAKPEPGKD